jgi:putative DNA primase/helicase
LNVKTNSLDPNSWLLDVENGTVDLRTDEYRVEMDVIGNFIKERCVQGAGCTIRARKLFKCYQDWCDENNEHACGERFLGLRHKDLGIEQKRLGDGRYWQGLGIKAELS